MPEVHFVGEIRCARGFRPGRLELTTNALSSLSASWQVHSSDDRHWRHMEGDTRGATWLAQREEPLGIAMWNSPLDFTYAFTSINGWPSILITVLETDRYERQDLGGYAVLRLPTTPGKHVRQLPVSRPSGSWGEAFTAFFVGGRPRYDHPLVLLSGDSRYGHQTVSMGMVEVELQVSMQGFNEPQLQHVKFDTDRSQAALEAASVCEHCPSSANVAGGRRDADDEGDDDEADASNQTKADEQPLLSRKQQ